MAAKAVITAMIMPITVPGGPPGGIAKPKTKMARPIPAIVPRAIPPRRAPIRMQASRMQNSIQIMDFRLRSVDRDGQHRPSRRGRNLVGLKELLQFRARPRLE